MDEEVSAREESQLQAVDEAGQEGMPPDSARPQISFPQETDWLMGKFWQQETDWLMEQFWQLEASRIAYRNSPAACSSVAMEVPKESVCLVWMDGGVTWGSEAAKLLERLKAVLARFVEVRLFGATSNAFCDRRMKHRLCGRVCSGEATFPDFERVQGLLELRRPGTGDKLMTFVHTVRGLQSALPELATLREMLKVCLKGTKRTRRVATPRMMAMEEWTDQGRTTWEAVRSRIAHGVPMCHPKKEN